MQKRKQTDLTYNKGHVKGQQRDRANTAASGHRVSFEVMRHSRINSGDGIVHVF
jgi:hypothetical protein